MVFATRDLPYAHQTHLSGFFKAFKRRWLTYYVITLISEPAILTRAPTVDQLGRLAPGKRVAISARNVCYFRALKSADQSRCLNNLHSTLAKFLQTMLPVRVA